MEKLFKILKETQDFATFLSVEVEIKRRIIDLKAQKFNGLKDSRNLIFNKILDKIEMITGIEKKDIISKCRKNNYVEARQALCFILHTKFKLSFPTIAYFMKFGHHASVWHSCNIVENQKKRFDYILKHFENEKTDKL